MGTSATAAGTLVASAACIALLQRFEGCAKKRADGRFDAYPDPGTGKEPWTIGWGSTGVEIKRGTIWTQEQADARLKRDVEAFSLKVAGLLKGVPTTQAQFDAMVSFAYNVGVGNLASSTLLKMHRAGNCAGAERQFALWNKAAGKVLPGLVKRRAAEAALYAGKRP